MRSGVCPGPLRRATRIRGRHIGVETRYGGYLGKHRVIDALATLAFSTIRAAPGPSRVS